jgi:uncharacterized membrane protein
VSDNRARMWFGLFVLVVFLLGGAGGFVAGRLVPPIRGARFGPPPDGPGGDGFRRGGPGGPGRGPLFGRGPGAPALPPQLLDRLTRDVQLDATQREQIRKVLEERRDRFEDVHREARERFDKEQRDLHAAIRAVLRPDQQQKFDDFLDRRPPPPDRRPQ